MTILASGRQQAEGSLQLDATGSQAREGSARNLNHGLVTFDTGAQHLLHRLSPPVIRKDFDLRIAGKALRLDGGARGFDVDDAVAHHAAVVEDVLGRHQPVADMERPRI